jgi:methyltransferase family protein
MSATAMSVEERLRALIESGLALPYTSHSGFDGTATGNHYQSVALGGEATSGFRGDRAAVLDCVDFRGRKVLDLGSNLGEMSRSARARGARLVDGVEYDPFFVELAQLVTAFNRQSRVSFRQGDITDPSIYRERYDVVLALSVFHYVSRVLDEIAAITDVLILETHMLHGNFDSGYLLPVQERFPSMRVLGQTDWGQMGDGSETRLVIAFAKERAQLGEILTAPHAWSQPPSSPAPLRAERMIDPAATALHWKFFEAWDYHSAEDLLSAVAAAEIPVDALAANRNVSRHGYSGWGYWFLYLKGWLHWRATGEAGAGNPYFEYMTRHYAPAAADAALGRALGDPAVAEERIRRRFEDLDRFDAAGGKDVAEEVAPIRAIVGTTPPRVPLELTPAGGGKPIPARRIDGWHRLFGARLLGVPRLRAEIVEEPRGLPLLRGAVEGFSIVDGTIKVKGWCLDADGPLDAIELRRGGDTVGLALPNERADVAKAFADVAHAERSGFAIEGPLHDWKGEPTRFELVGVRDWLPVGRLRIDWEPGVLEAPAPPAEIAQRVYGHADPVRLALRTALAANALLDAVAHYRELERFRAVVHWNAGCALLARAAARRLPEAAFTSLGTDADALAWAREAGAPGEFVEIGAQPPTPLAERAADLVLRDRPLAELGADALTAWLDELLRILRAGGYAALVGGWPADQRPEMLERCGGRLDVVGAASASAWPGGDVIVLRRP